MKTPEKPIFFVGYATALPPGLRVFVPVAMVVLICLFAGLGFAVGGTQDDPGDGRFRYDLGTVEVTGMVTARPYPTLTVTDGGGLYAAGHVVMLAGQGKRGAMAAEGLDGAVVRARGIALARGDLDMLQVAARDGVVPVADVQPAHAPDLSLGRWRIAGEICDGKCLAGAMRPGRGLAHKACANLCLIGDIPPVFATTAPVAGHRFVLMAGPDGGMLPASVRDHTAVLVEVEGEVVRRGDLMILRVDPATLRVL